MKLFGEFFGRRLAADLVEHLVRGAEPKCCLAALRVRALASERREGQSEAISWLTSRWQIMGWPSHVELQMLSYHSICFGTHHHDGGADATRPLWTLLDQTVFFCSHETELEICERCSRDTSLRSAF